MGAVVVLAGVFFVSFFGSLTHTDIAGFTGLLQIAYSVVAIIARFSFKASMEKHYNTAEPMGLSLSGVMTFFFGGIYFQYHMNDINRRKLLDRMYASGR
jgi:drug/metabolite transporter (DMT)-like permease